MHVQKFVLSELSVKECSSRENWCWLVAEVTETHSFMRSGVHRRGAEDSSLLGFHNIWPGKFIHPPWKQWNLFTSQHCVTFYKVWIFRYSFVIYSVVTMPSIYKYIKMSEVLYNKINYTASILKCYIIRWSCWNGWWTIMQPEDDNFINAAA